MREKGYSIRKWTERHAIFKPNNSFAVLLAFHKPFGVISQFTSDGSPHRTLADFQFPKGIYPIGRLDAESEGLLLLSDEAALNARLLHPSQGHWRTYWALVERVPAPESFRQLENGVLIGGHNTLPGRAWLLDPQPQVAPRNPPVRYRKNVVDVWIALELVEGKNHQVRRMTAAVGHPTLRLIRVRIGDFELGDLPAGQWRELNQAERAAVFSETRKKRGTSPG
jgi:23S rRNA pseudouridine2457 synthase